MCVTFIALHKLLQHKEPSPFPFLFLYEYLEYFGLQKFLPKQENIPKIVLKPNSESIRRLTLDIDKYFITKWYCSISDDPDFSNECKVFLEEVLNRIVEVQLQANNKVVLHGILNLYLKHLKEFRKSIKRKEKYNGDIEELYRYSHVGSTLNSKKPTDYFLHQLTTNLLRYFINSELWNSLPCHILVSILARKFVFYLLNMLSSPEVLNYLILSSVASKEIQEKFKLNEYGRISFLETDVVAVKKTETIDEKTHEKIEKTVEEETTAVKDKMDKLQEKAKDLDKKVAEATEKQKLKQESVSESKQDASQGTDTQEKVILRKKWRPLIERDSSLSSEKSSKRSEPVKIYEPKSTVRTWRDSRDLNCVSLGQDPLDGLHFTTDSAGKTASSKIGFWESTVKPDDGKQDSPPTAAIILNEVMTSMEGLKSSIKPISDATERTLHNIKDLQETTVHNALNKMSDFQDEAAGVVEGILDFGRAGFRKGLRLTGLQDNIETAKASFTNVAAVKATTKTVRDQVKKRLEELKRSDSDSQEKLSSAESADSVWINPLQIDSPTFDGQILLEKHPKKTETDGDKVSKLENTSIPSISMEQPTGTDSPDPEYEDTSDLASSIAKLRSLLQQRSSESSLSTPALSPMPDEYAQKQGESENASDVEVLEVDGMMPSFYKFCTKTASGVFSNTINTIKTALPGNNAEQFYTVEKWKFTSEQKESECFIKMKKLLTERKEYCILDKDIDTGYDALDSVDIFQQSPVLMTNLQFEDEFDDFEGKIPVTKVLLDIFCELLAESDSPLIQEPLVKAVLLTFGTNFERKINAQVDKTMEYLAENLITIPEKSKTTVLNFKIDDYIDAIRSSFPDLIGYVLGRESFKEALKLFILSLQSKKMNQDVILQAFEIIAMKLIEESTQMSPPASA